MYGNRFRIFKEYNIAVTRSTFNLSMVGKFSHHFRTFSFYFRTHFLAKFSIFAREFNFLRLSVGARFIYLLSVRYATCRVACRVACRVPVGWQGTLNKLKAASLDQPCCISVSCVLNFHLGMRMCVQMLVGSGDPSASKLNSLRSP